VSIPARIRREMHKLPGVKLRWSEISDDECTVTVEGRKASCGAEAALGHAATFRKIKSTAEWLGELREGKVE
jgi:hypothetical protein